MLLSDIASLSQAVCYFIWKMHKITPRNCQIRAETFHHLILFYTFQLTWIAYSCGLNVKLAYGEEQIVSYLPLSHIAAQIADIFMPIMYGATVWFAQPDALKVTLTFIPYGTYNSIQNFRRVSGSGSNPLGS